MENRTCIGPDFMVHSWNQKFTMWFVPAQIGFYMHMSLSILCPCMNLGHPHPPHLSWHRQIHWCQYIVLSGAMMRTHVEHTGRAVTHKQNVVTSLISSRFNQFECSFYDQFSPQYYCLYLLYTFGQIFLFAVFIASSKTNYTTEKAFLRSSHQQIPEAVGNANMITMAGQFCAEVSFLKLQVKKKSCLSSWFFACVWHKVFQTMITGSNQDQKEMTTASKISSTFTVFLGNHFVPYPARVGRWGSRGPCCNKSQAHKTLHCSCTAAD